MNALAVILAASALFLAVKANNTANAVKAEQDWLEAKALLDQFEQDYEQS